MLSTCGRALRTFPAALAFTALAAAGSGACGGAVVAPHEASHDAGPALPPADDATSDCAAPNPGCCGQNAQGCNTIIAGAVCEGGQWACPGGAFPPGECDALCEELPDADVPTPVLDAQVPIELPDAQLPSEASAGCPSPNPQCCGEAPNGCNQLISPAVCDGDQWTCPHGLFAPGVCDSLCMAVDASGPPADAF